MDDELLAGLLDDSRAWASEIDGWDGIELSMVVEVVVVVVV